MFKHSYGYLKVLHSTYLFMSLFPFYLLSSRRRADKCHWTGHLCIAWYFSGRYTEGTGAHVRCGFISQCYLNVKCSDYIPLYTLYTCTHTHYIYIYIHTVTLLSCLQIFWHIFNNLKFSPEYLLNCSF